MVGTRLPRVDLNAQGGRGTPQTLQVQVSICGRLTEGACISCEGKSNTLPGTPTDETQLTNGPKKLGVRTDD